MSSCRVEVVRVAYFDPLAELPSRLDSLDQLVNILEEQDDNMDPVNVTTLSLLSAMLSEQGLQDPCAEIQLKNATLLGLVLQHRRELQDAFLQQNGLLILLTLLKAPAQPAVNKSKYLTALSAALGNHAQGLSELYALGGQETLTDLLQEPGCVKKTLWIIYQALLLAPATSSVIWKDVGLLAIVKSMSWPDEIYSVPERTDILELIDRIESALS